MYKELPSSWIEYLIRRLGCFRSILSISQNDLAFVSWIFCLILLQWADQSLIVGIAVVVIVIEPIAYFPKQKPRYYFGRIEVPTAK